MKPYFSFQWHITDECDQRCKYCYIFSAGNHTCLQSMNWEQMENTFYNCLDFCEVYGRTPYFYITGGDPILHPDFWRLLELIHEHGVKFTILGNHGAQGLQGEPGPTGPQGIQGEAGAQGEMGKKCAQKKTLYRFLYTMSFFKIFT